jgi:hypothetical protein
MRAMMMTQDVEGVRHLFQAADAMEYLHRHSGILMKLDKLVGSLND